MLKRFDAALYAENDKRARDAVKALLPELDIRDNIRKRGVDMLVHDSNGKHVFNIETEIKKTWIDNFKFKDVNFPERKKKYAELDLPTFFIMFNNDLSQFLVVCGEDLLTSPLEIVPNRYISYGEKFFKVPLTKVHFNNILVFQEYDYMGATKNVSK
jgi:hypothetical protein